MEKKKKVISFIAKNNEYITVGELKQHLDDFDDLLPITVFNKDGEIESLTNGNIYKYNLNKGLIDPSDPQYDNYKESDGFDKTLLLYPM